MSVSGPFSSSPYPVLEVSSASLQHNLNLIKQVISTSIGQKKVLIPVKANAYGMGIEAIMPFLQSSEIDFLGVANIFEGINLRKLGWKKSILILGSFYTQNSENIFKYNLIPTIVEVSQIALLDQIAKKHNKKLDVHLKIDTGMHRLGVKIEDLKYVIEKFTEASHLNITGIYTHLSTSDASSSHYSDTQLALFDDSAKHLISKLNLNRKEIILHAANSYAMMKYRQSHYDMVRPGISFFGYYQTLKDLKYLQKRFPWKPVVTIRAKFIAKRRLRRGEKVSYGASYHVKRDILSGIIPLGYADGIPRGLGNNIHFDGYPLLGNVTMDQIILGNISNDVNEIALLGEHSEPLERWADLSNTITYEIMTRLGPRLQRKLI